MGSNNDLEPILSLDLYYNIRTHFVKRLYDLIKKPIKGILKKILTNRKVRLWIFSGSNKNKIGEKNFLYMFILNRIYLFNSFDASIEIIDLLNFNLPAVVSIIHVPSFKFM